MAVSTRMLAFTSSNARCALNGCANKAVYRVVSLWFAGGLLYAASLESITVSITPTTPHLVNSKSNFAWTDWEHNNQISQRMTLCPAKYTRSQSAAVAWLRIWFSQAVTIVPNCGAERTLSCVMPMSFRIAGLMIYVVVFGLDLRCYPY